MTKLIPGAPTLGSRARCASRRRPATPPNYHLPFTNFVPSDRHDRHHRHDHRRHDRHRRHRRQMSLQPWRDSSLLLLVQRPDHSPDRAGSWVGARSSGSAAVRVGSAAGTASPDEGTETGWPRMVGPSRLTGGRTGAPISTPPFGPSSAACLQHPGCSSRHHRRVSHRAARQTQQSRFRLPEAH